MTILETIGRWFSKTENHEDHFAVGSYASTSEFSADRPIATSSEDHLGREPFARRIAETIVARRDTSSLVVGVYGPWGNGKTSVMNLITENLANHSEIVVVRFNPWFFSSEDTLIRGFFAQVAESISASGLANRFERLAEVVEQYAGTLAVVGAVFDRDIESAAKAAGVSGRSLQTLKARLTSILSKAKVKVVVLVDDIDRLDKSEIHTMLKLVKLCADLPYTSYILFFDDQVVAASISERYGAGDVAAGRAFLEKIIQVPLMLPPAGRDEINRLLIDGLNSVLDPLALNFTQADNERLGVTFGRAVAPLITTPRQVRRLINSLAFAVPILKGEVNLVDLIALEGIRVALPGAYDEIRAEPGAFIKPDLFTFGRDEVWQQQSKIVFDRIMEAVPPSHRDDVRNMLVELFPRLGVHTRRVSFTGDSDDRWSDEKRITSPDYFNRFFHYGVPPNDVRDQDVLLMFDVDSDRQRVAIVSVMESVKRRGSWTAFTGKLHRAIGEAQVQVLEPVAVAIARMSADIPEQHGFLSDLFSSSATAVRSIARILSRLPQDRRAAVARRTIEEAPTLTFTADLIRSFSTITSDEGRVIPDSDIPTLAALLIDRALKEASVDTPCLPYILYLVSEHRGQEQARAWVASMVGDDLEKVMKVISHYCGRSYSGGGHSSRGELSAEAYEHVAKFVEAKAASAMMVERYGKSIASDDYHGFGLGEDERLARQFCIQYRRATAVPETEAQPESIPEVVEQSATSGH